MNMRHFGIVAGAVTGVIVAGVAVAIVMKSRIAQPPREPAYSNVEFKKLPGADKSNFDTGHLASGVLPPTNRWFSGLALQSTPQPVFPLPLKFTPTETSFTVDLPNVATSGKLIQAVDNLPVTITMQNAHHYQVTRYDIASVELTYYSSDNQPVNTVMVVAGSPYIYIASHADGQLTATAQGGAIAQPKDTAVRYTVNGATIGIAPYKGATTKGVDGSSIIATPNGSYVTVFAGNSMDDWDKLLQYTQNRVVGTDVSYSHDKGVYTTTISYKTNNQQPTYYARLPHQGGGNGPAYNTIYGRVALQQGNALKYTTAAVDLKNQLPVNQLSNEHKQLLVTMLTNDVSKPTVYPGDSYFGGKALYRDAQLLVLANQLGQGELASKLQAQLKAQLATWLNFGSTEQKSFYYDTRAHGVVGVAPAFGSDSFNDHHFHYGYFIYAASVLARYDPTFKQQYQQAVNVLIADIANNVADKNFPKDRAFDAYFGHSWASGSAPFADGNNQESSAEAINAWVGMGLWAEQISDASMAEHAGWLLSNEVAATGAYWLNFDMNSQPYSAGYNQNVVALNWGGKRDYATFFSASPKAMLGIQLLPMSPTSAVYLAPYGEKITQQVQQARRDQPLGEQFDDYLLMYEALRGGGAKLLDTATALPDAAIDGASSRSYLYAWLLTH